MPARWLAALTAALLACACGGEGGSPPQRWQVLATISVGRGASTPIVGGGFVWVPNSNEGTLSKIDPRSNREVARIRIGDTNTLLEEGCGDRNVHQMPPQSWEVRNCNLPSAAAFIAGSLWVTKNDDHSLLRLDPRGGKVLATIPLGITEWDLGGDEVGVWVTDYQHGLVVRVDPGVNRVTARLEGFHGPTSVTVAGRSVWVVASREDAVYRIDPATSRVTARIAVPVPDTAHLGARPLPIAVTPGSVWVRNEYLSNLTRIDIGYNRAVSTVDVGAFTGRDGLDGMAVAGGQLWVSGIQLQRVDPATNRVVQLVPHTGITLAYGEGSLWVTDIVGTISRLRVTA